MSKKYFLIVGLAIFGIAGFGYWYFIEDKPTAQRSAEHETTGTSEEREEDDGAIRLIATGDTIAHDSINAQAEQAGQQNGQDGGFEYLPMMERMKPFFSGADIRFCNQATPAGGEEFGISGYPVFNAPLELSHDMASLGCNVVNTGTNHTYDKGQKVIDSMVAEWDKLKILAHAGANRSAEERDTVKYFEVKGVKFAFLSYTTYSNDPVSSGYGVTMYSKDLAKRQLDEAKQNADLNIVSMRWGTEYSESISDFQQNVGQELSDMGADIVFGHGPHTLQPVKKLKGSGGNETLVWYSLGNFLNTQLDIETLTGAIGVMDIDTASKKVELTGAVPIYNHYEWTEAQKSRQDLLARKNIEMYPLDQSGNALKRSQHKTAPQAQTARIKGILNRYTSVPIINSNNF